VRASLEGTTTSSSAKSRTRTLNGRVEAIEIASLRKFYLETVAMPFEAERIVKSVGVFSLQIAR
jgi:hypothetical protein